MRNALKLHADDTVVTMIADVAAGERVTWEEGVTGVEALDAVPFGHKVAVREMAAGSRVMKYGASIGRAIEPIAVGRHVHTHNLKSVRGAAKG